MVKKNTHWEWSQEKNKTKKNMFSAVVELLMVHGLETICFCNSSCAAQNSVER